MDEIDDIDRKQILESVIETIVGISDKDYQTRIWIKGEGPECDDFDETVCRFFCDVDPMLKEYKKFGLSQEQYNILFQFRNNFDAFCYDNNFPILFIDTPEWTKITKEAKEVLNALDKA